jgi:hypothetical protein
VCRLGAHVVLPDARRSSSCPLEDARFRNAIPAEVEEFDQLEPETLAMERLKEVRSADRR